MFPLDVGEKAQIRLDGGSCGGVRLNSFPTCQHVVITIVNLSPPAAPNLLPPSPSLPVPLAHSRTAGKNYPPDIQAALGRAHLLYINGKVVEASTELTRVVVQCASVSGAVVYYCCSAHAVRADVMSPCCNLVSRNL